MKITHVPLKPSEAALDAGRIPLAPELMAAVAARFSRNDEGLEAILKNVDPENEQKSIQSIFNMADYGHQSILNLVGGVAISMEKISIFLAYWIFTLTPTGSGSESSTRYIKMGVEHSGSPEEYGIPEQHHELWKMVISDAYKNYDKAVAYWTGLSQENPAIMNIPKEILEDTSEKGLKVIERMRRNYAFDRSRYFLPVAAKTNVFLVMDARGWASLIRQLDSTQWPEAKALAVSLREELGLVSPRSVKYSSQEISFDFGWQMEFSRWQNEEEHTFDQWDDIELSTFGTEVMYNRFKEDLKVHNNRYSFIGSQMKRVTVSRRIKAVSMGDMRDLNRHRTGNQWMPLVPQGFYGAFDQLPETAKMVVNYMIANGTPYPDENIAAKHENLPDFNWGRKISMLAAKFLQDGDPSFIYWTILGTQFPYEHVTQADKFIYEAELRTGAGAHYRYKKHEQDWLDIWFKQFPDTQKFITVGKGEPE